MTKFFQAGREIRKPTRKSRISNIIVIRGPSGSVGRSVASSTAKTAQVPVILLGKSEDYHVDPQGTYSLVDRASQPALFHTPAGFLSRGDYDSLR